METLESNSYGTSLMGASILQYQEMNQAVAQNEDEKSDEVGSGFDHQRIKSYLLKPGLTLVNPFDPSFTKKRVSSNRRRWTHIFSAWSSKLTTGVDWKSLTIPASLPITTDFFPDQTEFANEYVFNEYNLNPDEITGEINSFNLDDIFIELVSQRLAQGFQIVDLPEFPVKFKNKPSNEFWLSIGRIFHRVALFKSQSLINVTRYSPKTPYPNHNMDYHYRFQAPDNDSYEVSWVKFKTEKLENFNWNHNDYYVITRGDNDFKLKEALKYWRFRMYLIPLTAFAPFTKKIRESDVDNCDIYDFNIDESNLTDGFLKFIEMTLNGLRKKVLEPDNKDVEEHEDIKVLKAKIPFITHCNLPKNTFVSFDAIRVLSREKLEILRNKNLIRHCSGNKNFPVKYGFYLYYICDKNNQNKNKYNGDLDEYQNDWIEIGFKPENVEKSYLNKSVERFKREESKFIYKSVTLDLDPLTKSDRPEWGHIKYQSEFDPDAAFDVILQWSVATGSLVSEIINGWARKSQQQSGLSLIPIPSDPFALPVTPNSDPVRGPIFIELDTSVLNRNSFESFTFDQALFLFRETVARKFGFIPCSTENKNSSANSMFSTHHQYIHCTGNFFLLIPTHLQLKTTGIQGYRRQNNMSKSSSYNFDEENTESKTIQK